MRTPEPHRGAGRRLAGAMMLLPLLGCASNTAPADSLPRPAESQQESYGGWIELEVDDGGKKRRSVEGELLAVSDSGVWLLGQSGGVVIATASVKKGKLTGYQSGAGAIAGYSALGTLSTLSNGVLLVFTAPMWIIGGAVAAGSESRQPVRSTPPLKWPELAAWARFPQGLPEGLDFARLRQRPRRQ